MAIWNDFGWDGDGDHPPYPWVTGLPTEPIDPEGVTYRHFDADTYPGPGSFMPAIAYKLQQQDFYQQYKRTDFSWFWELQRSTIKAPIAILEVDFSGIPGWLDMEPQGLIPPHPESWVVNNAGPADGNAPGDYLAPGYEDTSYSDFPYDETADYGPPTYDYDNPPWPCPSAWLYMGFAAETAPVLHITRDDVDESLWPFRTRAQSMNVLADQSGAPGYQWPDPSTDRAVEVAVDQRWPYGIGARKFVPFRWSHNDEYVQSSNPDMRLYSTGDDGDDQLAAVTFRLHFPLVLPILPDLAIDGHSRGGRLV